MKTLKIVTDKEKLQQISKTVDMSNLKEIQQLIKNMKKYLESIPNGAGLSAIQIGKPLRLFLVDVGEKYPKIIPFINPVITKYSEEKEYGNEGCLSFPYKYGNIKRNISVNIEYIDIYNKPRSQTLTGFIARVAQHEYDHLNGICCVDKMNKEKD
jgi:peptide deformylase